MLGQASILVSLAAAVFGSILGWASVGRPSFKALRWARGAAYVFALGMGVANGVMVGALITHDFSVSYVAHVGSRATPWLLTVVSLWSSLEGSLLFWGLILGVYVSTFAYLLRQRHGDMMGPALGSVLAISAFFAWLIAAPANPFLPVFPVPSDGPGPNPLLQNHPLMIIHPPMLYSGYVGMTIPFGMAVAALVRGTLREGWMKLMRRWMMVPWLFLSVGILLGAWWAYEVLGWGGYWAWDPVENASFLPWLAATSYMHATVVQERKRILTAWTLSLVLGAFMLTLLGTFMTRSGVFNSVHSFTQSAMGPVFLGFLGVVLLGSLGLVASRSHLLADRGRIEAFFSRETAFVCNNVVLGVFTLTVLLGTMFPLISEAVWNVKISVGEPYFNRMAVPLGLALVFLMGVGPVLPWGQPCWARLKWDFVVPSVAGLLGALGAWAAGLRQGLALVTFGLCGFAAWVTLRALVMPAWHRFQKQAPKRGENFGRVWLRWVLGNRRQVGGYGVHLAVIAVVAAIAGSQTGRISVEASLARGESGRLGPYTFTYLGAEGRQEPHRFLVVATVRVGKGDQVLGRMEPKLVFYPTQREPVGTPHVATLGSRDLYMSLVSVEKDGSRVGLKVFLIPLVPWIWRSLPLVVLGALVSLWPRRQSKLAPMPSSWAVKAL